MHNWCIHHTKTEDPRLNYCLDGKHAIKATFPGATVEKAAYYMKPTLEEESPDIVILNIGTNNLTKNRHHTEEDIAGAIINMVEECRKMGVNEIFVSGLTVRKGWFKQIKIINNILSQKASTHNFNFIDNENIKYEDLSYDGLHLQKEGTIKLADTFIYALNNMSNYNLY